MSVEPKPLKASFAGLSEFRQARGDVFWEVEEIAKYLPVISVVSPYVHRYEGAGAADQDLSTELREIVVTLVLLALDNVRFAANHVRRLYRLGVTAQVLMECGSAATPHLGYPILLKLVEALKLADSKENTEGGMPAGGPPTELIRFKELDLGEVTPEDLDQRLDLISKFDPKLAELVGEDYRYAMYPNFTHVVPYGCREVIAFALLCFKGNKAAARHLVPFALTNGASRRMLLESASSAGPSSGVATVIMAAEILSSDLAVEKSSE